MNLREYAEHRTRNGNTCTKQAIEKHMPKLRMAGAAIQVGRFWDIDAAAADAIMAGVDPTKGKPPEGNTGGRPPFSNSHHTSAREEGSRLATPGGVVSQNIANSTGMLLMGRAAIAQIRAQDAKADLDKKLSKLLDADEVKRRYVAMVKTAQNRLLGIGNKLAPYLALESDPAMCRELVDAEMYEALAELAQLSEAATREVA